MEHARRSSRAILAVLLGGLVACATPVATPTPAAPMPMPSPTSVPLPSAPVTPSPSPRPGAGLGCGDPIGSADEVVLVESGEESGMVVSAIAPDGGRRLLAEIPGAGQPVRADVSPCGHLAVQAGDQVTVYDLHDPGRRVRMTDAATEDGAWALGRDGRITLIDGSWGNVIVFDPRDATTTRRPWPEHVFISAWTAWDGSGWYAETASVEPYGPPERAGVVDVAGTFRQSAVLRFDPHGFLWATAADGSIAWVRYGVGADDHRALDVHTPDGLRTTWRHAPPGREFDHVSWDAPGTGLWVVEADRAQARVLHVTGPGETTEVRPRVVLVGGTYPALFDAAGSAMVLRGSGDDRGPATLSRLDLASGDLQVLAEDIGDGLVAGWAAPASPAPGVTPPAPFGSPEPVPSPSGPVAPELPVDALAIVTCSASGTAVSRPTVRALEDGVHFLVRHPDGSAAGVGTTDGGPIEGYAVVALAPGVHEIDCGEAAVPTPARIEVLDPAGRYRPATLDCAKGGGTVSSMDGEPVPGPEAAAWLRPQLTLAPGDIVQPGGYPTQTGPPIVVLRAGRVIARFHVLRAGGELAIAAAERCADANVGP